MDPNRLIIDFKKQLGNRNTSAVHALDIFRDLRDVLEQETKSDPLLAAIRENILRLFMQRSCLLPDLEREAAVLNLILQDSRSNTAEISSGLEEWGRSVAELSEILRGIKTHVTQMATRHRMTEQKPSVVRIENSNFSEARELNIKILACEMLLGSTDPAPFPPNMQVESTSRCNARCRICGHFFHPARAYRDLDFQVFLKLSPVLPYVQCLELHTYGEASLAPHFTAMCEVCRSFGCRTHVLTNGSTLGVDSPLADVDQIGISVDSDNERTFDAVRKGLRFKTVIENIKAFRRRNPDNFMYFLVTIHRANVDEISGIAGLACDLGLQAVCLSLMSAIHPSLRPVTLTAQDVPLYREEVEKAERICSKRGVDVYDYAFLDGLPDQTEPLNKEACLRVFESLIPPSAGAPPDIEELTTRLAKIECGAYPASLHRFFTLEAASFESTRKAEIERVHEDTSMEPVTVDTGRLKERLHELRSEIERRGRDALVIPYCTAPWFRLEVKADGGIFPCCSWKGPPFADLAVQSVAEIWHGPFMTALRQGCYGEGELPPFCLNCRSIDRYQGLTETISTMNEFGLDYNTIRKIPGFSPPPGKLQLIRAGAPEIEYVPIDKSYPGGFYELRGDAEGRGNRSSGYDFVISPGPRLFCERPSSMRSRKISCGVLGGASLPLKDILKLEGRPRVSITETAHELFPSGLLFVSVRFRNEGEVPLFGRDSHPDCVDRAGLRVLKQEAGVTSAAREERMDMPFEWILPGSEYHISGLFDFSGLEPGTYTVETGIVREGEFWISEESERRSFEITTAEASTMTPVEVSRVPGSKGIALTFDAGASIPPSDALLDFLQKRRMQCTVFLTGRSIASFPEHARRIANEGHEAANHTYNHPWLSFLHDPHPAQGVDKDFLMKELYSTEEAFFKTTGRTMSRLWRAPYGARNAEILKWAMEEGFTHVFWSHDSNDWRIGSSLNSMKCTPQSVFETLKNKLRQFDDADGAVVLFHLSTYNQPDMLSEMSKFIDWIAGRGLAFRTAGSLLTMI